MDAPPSMSKTYCMKTLMLYDTFKFRDINLNSYIEEGLASIGAEFRGCNSSEQDRTIWYALIPVSFMKLIFARVSLIVEALAEPRNKDSIINSSNPVSRNRCVLF